jgi:hypothetical protein
MINIRLWTNEIKKMEELNPGKFHNSKNMDLLIYPKFKIHEPVEQDPCDYRAMIIYGIIFMILYYFFNYFGLL